VAPVSETYPCELWGYGEYVADFLELFDIPGKRGNFFDLMPQADIDQIRDVANKVWGADLENPGAVRGGMSKVATDIPDIIEDIGKEWSDDAFEAFKEMLERDQSLFSSAAAIAENVGQALTDFADAVDQQLTDGVAMFIGVLGAIVGALVGSPGGPPGATAGAIAGFAIGIAFAYYGTLFPKVVSAVQATFDLSEQLPPDSAA
jgi:hypothetical protein